MNIGFSGHQVISHPERWEWVQEQFQHVLKQWAKAGDRLSSSLAKGGDQLISKLAIEGGLAIEAVVPCMGYEEAFGDAEGLAQYRDLLSKAAEIITLDFPQPSEDAFLAAGKRIVEQSDRIIALWNGKKAAGKGGTGDIVEYARGMGRIVIQVNPDSMQVHYLGSEEEDSNAGIHLT